MVDRAAEEIAARIIQKKYKEFANGKYNLRESQKDFIRPWYRRWRTKSIFQVLLLYRAERLQAFVNFCLQTHLYNQSCVSDIQKIKDPINLEEMDGNAKVAEYLPPQKRAIPTFHFTWESLAMKDDVSDYKPLPDFNLAELQAQAYANTSQRTATKKETCVTTYEDKEVQTSLSKTNSPVLNDHIPDDIPELKEELRKPPINGSFEISKGNTRSVRVTDRNVRLVPKPSDLSKGIAKVNECNFQTSLTEMEEKFKNKNYNETGDEPPFNFRSLLKKTDPTAGKRKTLGHQIVQREMSTLAEGRPSNHGSSSQLRPSEACLTELGHGIFLYGRVTDL